MRNVLGALAVAVLMGGIMLYLQGPATSGPGLDSAAPIGVGSAEAPRSAVASPEVWRAAFPLEPAPVHEGGDTAGARALTAALEPYRQGDYQKAASALEGVWLDHPDEHRAALYLGVSRLFIDEVPAAIEILRSAQLSPDARVAAEAQWYVLVGIARLREPDSGLADVREACERPGPYSARACAALEQLVSPHSSTR